MNEQELFIRRDEGFKLSMLAISKAKENVRKLQEEGMPLFQNSQIIGIWYAGFYTSEKMNWHYVPFNQLEFNRADPPQSIVSIPRNTDFIWSLRDCKPTVLIT